MTRLSGASGYSYEAGTLVLVLCVKADALHSISTGTYKKMHQMVLLAILYCTVCSMYPYSVHVQPPTAEYMPVHACAAVIVL